jgi:hypothetical protein
VKTQTEEPKTLEELIIKNSRDLDQLYGDTMFPNLLMRIKAFFIDLGIVLSVFVGATLLIDGVGEVPDASRGFVFIFMLYLYDPLLTAFTGSTLGHKALKLKIRKYDLPEKKISLWQASVRFLLKATLGWLSFLTVTGTKHKRAIHDIMSGSIMLVDKSRA